MIVVSLALGFAIDNVSCAYGWIYEMEEGHHRFRHLGAPRRPVARAVAKLPVLAALSSTLVRFLLMEGKCLFPSGFDPSFLLMEGEEAFPSPSTLWNWLGLELAGEWLFPLGCLE